MHASYVVPPQYEIAGFLNHNLGLQFINFYIFHMQTLVERTLRYMVFNWMPRWVMRKGAVKDLLYRPLAMFLPLPEVRGPLERLPQKPCKRGLVDQRQTSVV